MRTSSVVAAVIVVVAAGVARADRCLPIQVALAAQKTAEAANEASLEKELVKQKLALAKLVRHKPSPQKPGQRPLAIDKVVTMDGVDVVFTGSQMMCGALIDTEFVRRGSQIFRFQRQPRYAATRIQACDCYFPGYRCGGAVPPTIAMLYELPAGTTYAGTIAVAYDAQNTTIAAGVASKTACVPPPPPP